MRTREVETRRVLKLRRSVAVGGKPPDYLADVLPLSPKGEPVDNPGRRTFYPYPLKGDRRTTPKAKRRRVPRKSGDPAGKEKKDEFG